MYAKTQSYFIHPRSFPRESTVGRFARFLNIISSKYHIILGFSSVNVLVSVSSPVAVESFKARKHLQSQEMYGMYSELK